MHSVGQADLFTEKHRKFMAEAQVLFKSSVGL